MVKFTTSKLTILLISLLVAGYGLVTACAPDVVFLSCHSYFTDIPFTVWSIALAVFLVSLFMIFLREEIFRAWIKFVLCFIPIYIILVFYAPDYSNDLIFALDKKRTALLLARLFFIVSLLIIAIKSWRLRKTAKG